MNMGFLLYPWGDPRISEFVDNTDLVNGIANRSPGFVWRLDDEGYELPENDLGNLFGRPDVAVATLSVWESCEDLEQFVHQTLHGRFLKRRAEWFEYIEAQSYVIWPVEVGHTPSLTEGRDKLALLRESGSSHEAYDFKFWKTVQQIDMFNITETTTR